MKSWLFSILIIIFVVLQYQLWFSKHGIINLSKLKRTESVQLKKSAELKSKIEHTKQKFETLKRNDIVAEEAIRSSDGMIKKGEIFYRLNDNKK